MGNDYWVICAESILDEFDLSLPSGQIEAFASRMRDAAEMESESCGHYLIPNPETERANKAESALRIEQSMVGCAPCGGTGRLKYNTGPWAVDTQCDRCGGKGKHRP